MAEILLGGGSDERVRKDLIAQVLEAYARIAPKQLKEDINFLHEITKVEHSSGKWRTGKGELKVRLPQELFTLLRQAFNRFLPDEPMFGFDDSDIRLLYEVCPQLKADYKTRRSRGRGNRI